MESTTTAINLAAICNENVPDDSFAVYVAHKGKLYARMYPVEMFQDNRQRIIDGIARGIEGALADNQT
jgi:hypothetical protein